MVDTTTIILTAICTGIGISIGNALYEVFLKDHFIKLKSTKKKIGKKMFGRKTPWLAALLNFFFWGIGYFYIGKKRILAVLLILVQVFIVGNLSFSAAAIHNLFEAANYGLFTLFVSAFLAFDAYRGAKEINSRKE